MEAKQTEMENYAFEAKSEKCNNSSVSFLQSFFLFLLLFSVIVKSPTPKPHQCKKCKGPTALSQTLSTTRKSNNNVTQKRSVTIVHI